MRLLRWVVGVTLLWPMVCWAGPVFIIGHDADDHGFVCIYRNLMQEVLDNVTNGNSGILAIGTDSGTTAGNWINDIATSNCGASAPPLTPSQTITYVNDGNISTVSFDGYAILYVSSDSADTFGGITSGENNNLTARAADVADFVNRGGGLFGLTQGELSDAWGYLTGTGGLAAIETLDVDPSGLLPSGEEFDNVTSTAEGAALGVTDSNLDSCCWHNVFTSYPSFFDVLMTANEPAVGDENFNGQAAGLGGVTTCFPGTQPRCFRCP